MCVYVSVLLIINLTLTHSLLGKKNHKKEYLNLILILIQIYLGLILTLFLNQHTTLYTHSAFGIKPEKLPTPDFVPNSCNHSLILILTLILVSSNTNSDSKTDNH